MKKRAFLNVFVVLFAAVFLGCFTVDASARVVTRPDFISRVQRNATEHALRISVSDIAEESIHPWGGGARAFFDENVTGEEGATRKFLINFEARHLEGANQLYMRRTYGGSSSSTVQLSDEWEKYSATIESAEGIAVSAIFFTPVEGRFMAPSVIEIDNVEVYLLGEDDEPVGDNLLINGTFDWDTAGWTGLSRLIE